MERLDDGKIQATQPVPGMHQGRNEQLGPRLVPVQQQRGAEIEVAVVLAENDLRVGHLENPEKADGLTDPIGRAQFTTARSPRFQAEDSDDAIAQLEQRNNFV